LFAAVLTTLGPRVADLSRLIVQINEAFLAVVMVVMRIAPIGIFCLVAARFGEAAAAGPEEIRGLVEWTGWYVACVVIGLGIHMVVCLLVPLWLITGRNPFAFVAAMSESLLMAFSTASGLASLPVTLEVATSKAGISRRAAEFVLPLGAAVNTNGTALYEAVAALFIAQSLGIDLTFGQQAIVAVTATISAVGAAGIPEAGLVTLLIVLKAVDLPTDEIALILAVDWLLDRFRTTINVFGDVVGAAIVEPTMTRTQQGPVAD
jgi:solute carrier family 1 (neuronal/epithelial high affinity glutamate transporter), member 1